MARAIPGCLRVEVGHPVVEDPRCVLDLPPIGKWNVLALLMDPSRCGPKAKAALGTKVVHKRGHERRSPERLAEYALELGGRQVKRCREYCQVVVNSPSLICRQPGGSQSEVGFLQREWRLRSRQGI